MVGTLASTKCPSRCFATSKGKGRELRVDQLALEPQAQFVKARKKEWRNWLNHGVVEFLTKEQHETVPPDQALTLHIVEVDKNEAVRGGQSYEELPLRAESRFVVHGLKELDALGNKIRTGAPTFPPETVAFLVAALKCWHLHQGDVEAAFLSRDMMERGVYF